VHNLPGYLIIGTGVEIKNNIFWQTDGTIAATPSGVTWANNLWSKAPPAAAQSSTDPRYPTYGALDIADYLQKQTGWTNLAGTTLTPNDFKLRSTAANAIDKGANLGLPYNSDYFGNLQSGAWDIGALVYGGTTGAVCGNGVVETGEVCDNGSSNGICPQVCSSSCTANDCSSVTLKYVDSEELVGEDGGGVNALDGNQSTIWHTQWYNCSPSCAQHPHVIDIDLVEAKRLAGLSYLPRQDGNPNGTIAQYEVYVSADGETWGSPVASGIWAASTALKTAEFAEVNARYIRLKSLTEINGNPWTSAAEIGIIEGSVGGWPPGVPEPTWKWHLADNSGAAEIGTAWTLNGTTSATPDHQSAADQAMACAGSSSNYLSIADGTAPEFGSDTFSMVLRAKSNATPDSTWHPFLSKWTSGQKSWAIGHADDHDTIEFWGVDSGSDWPPDVFLEHDLGENWSGTWLHIGVVRDGSSWKLYINGSLADSGTVSCTLYNGTSPLYGFKDGDGYVFNGALDDVAFFDEALTAANIVALAAVGSNFGGEGGTPGTTTPKTMGVSGPASVLGVEAPSHVMGVGD
jgi:hypothetical protein